MCHRIFHLFFTFYLKPWFKTPIYGIYDLLSRFWLISRESMSTTPHFSMFRARPARRSCTRTGRRRGSCSCWGWWPCPRTRRCSWPGSGGCRSRHRGPGDQAPVTAGCCVVMPCVARLRNRPAHLAPRTNSVPSQLPWFEDDVPQTPIHWYSMFYFYYCYI